MVSLRTIPEPALASTGDSVVVAARDGCCGPVTHAVEKMEACFMGVLVISVQLFVSRLVPDAHALQKVGGVHDGSNRH
jgi:hypothetical protein